MGSGLLGWFEVLTTCLVCLRWVQGTVLEVRVEDGACCGCGRFGSRRSDPSLALFLSLSLALSIDVGSMCIYIYIHTHTHLCPSIYSIHPSLHPSVRPSVRRSVFSLSLSVPLSRSQYAYKALKSESARKCLSPHCAARLLRPKQCGSITAAADV